MERTNRLERAPLFWLTLCLLALSSRTVLAQEAATRTVLALYSQEPDAPLNQTFRVGLRRVLGAAPGTHIEYHEEFLDSFRFAGRDFSALERDYLRKKYANRHIDAIVTIGDVASNLVLGPGSELFSDTPVVTFGGIRPTRRYPAAASRVTGLFAAQDYRATVEMALRLHPAAKQVFVVLNTPAADQSIAAGVERQLEGIDRAPVTYLRGVPTPTLIATLNSAPADSIVLYVRQPENSDGRPVPSHEALAGLASAVHLPFYGSFAPYLGSGIVGGKVFDTDECGAIVGGMAVRVATGTPPVDVPQREAPLTMRFDARQLARWRIGDAQLPAESVIQFREPSVWSRYRLYIVIAVAITLTQTLLLVALGVQRMRRLGAEARNTAILRTLPDLMFVFDGDGVFRDFHARRPEDLLVPPDRFLGKHVREVMPPHLAETFMTSFEQARRSAEPCVVEYSLPVNGEDRTYEARIANYEGGKVLSIVRDITERQRASDALRAHDTALRVSDARVRDLGGRLIAAQEDERARIARDLHDDLSQRLALLGMEVDRFTGDLERDSRASQSVDIKGRVDEIASYVHQLAHELHPSKLRTLGLIAAVDSCCREVSARHEVAVHFTFEGVRKFVKPDTSLCLYRIVQESLHNVVKHSGATVAEVRLKCLPEYLELQVADPGCGFSPGADHDGLGLVSMRERVNHLGGSIVFHSAPGSGTRIGVRIPFREAVRGAAPREVAS